MEYGSGKGLPIYYAILEFNSKKEYHESTSRLPLAYDVESQTASADKRGLWQPGRIDSPPNPHDGNP
jgi:hypothetical protein